jgi:hypothetical protein
MRGKTARRGFVLLLAIAGVLVLLVFTALLTGYTAQGFRGERMALREAQLEMALFSLQAWSRSNAHRLEPGVQVELPVDALLPRTVRADAVVQATRRSSGLLLVTGTVRLQAATGAASRTREWTVRYSAGEAAAPASSPATRKAGDDE